MSFKLKSRRQFFYELYNFLRAKLLYITESLIFLAVKPTSGAENLEKIKVLDGDSVMTLLSSLALAEGAV